MAALTLDGGSGRTLDIELPVNVEAESALLGALFFDPNILDQVRDVVRDDDFSESLNRDIYRAICEVSDKGGTPNPITLRPYLDDNKQLKELGGSSYLASLVSGGAFIGGLDFAKQISELARRRRLIDACADTISRACKSDNADPIASIMEDADSSLTQILNNELSEIAGIKQVSAGVAFREMIDDMENSASGVTCGDIPSIDEVLGPIGKHHLIIGAGRPGMGKTAAALSYAVGAARRGHGVLFVTLEMSRIDLMKRAVSLATFDGRWGVPYKLIQNREIQGQDRQAVYRVGRDFDNLPLYFIDASGLTTGRLNAIVRRWKRRLAARGQSLDLVIVDYLQLMRPDTKTNSVYEAVSEVSRNLKGLAKMHEVGVFALAQLSRSVEQRADKRPMLSDLRDSGQIEQDADAVLFLYREEYYLEQAMTNPESPDYPKLEAARAMVTRQIDFIVAKRRNGQTGSAKGEFHGAFQAVRG